MEFSFSVSCQLSVIIQENVSIHHRYMNNVIVVPIHDSCSSLGFNLRPVPPDRKCISAWILLHLSNKTYQHRIYLLMYHSFLMILIQTSFNIWLAVQTSVNIWLAVQTSVNIWLAVKHSVDGIASRSIDIVKKLEKDYQQWLWFMLYNCFAHHLKCELDLTYW